jgi:hypothetical protein
MFRQEKTVQLPCFWLIAPSRQKVNKFQAGSCKPDQQRGVPGSEQRMMMVPGKKGVEPRG